jgi:hypothetical protein
MDGSRIDRSNAINLNGSVLTLSGTNTLSGISLNNLSASAVVIKAESGTLVVNGSIKAASQNSVPSDAGGENYGQYQPRRRHADPLGNSRFRELKMIWRSGYFRAELCGGHFKRHARAWMAAAIWLSANGWYTGGCADPGGALKLSGGAGGELGNAVTAAARQLAGRVPRLW